MYVTETIARRDAAMVHMATLHIAAAQTASGALDEQGFDRAQQRAIDAADEIAARFMPWHGLDKTERRKRVLDSMVADFSKIFGDDGSDKRKRIEEKILAKLQETDVVELTEEERILQAWQQSR